MRKYELLINGKNFEVEIQSLDDGVATVWVNGSTYQVEILGDFQQISRQVEGSAPYTTSRAVSSPSRPEPAKRTAAPTVTRPTPPPPPPSRVAMATASVKAGPGDVAAPMPGLILEVKVSEGDRVKTGEVVVRMEAMKMENDIVASRDGVISKVHVQKGSEVQSGQLLVTIAD